VLASRSWLLFVNRLPLAGAAICCPDDWVCVLLPVSKRINGSIASFVSFNARPGGSRAPPSARRRVASGALFRGLDLTTGPVVISVPDTRDHCYLLQLLDMWTDSFGELGSALLARAPAVLPWLALAGRVSSPLARNESTPRLRSEATIQSQR